MDTLKQSVYLIGGGTLAELIIDTLRRSLQWEPAGIFDDTKTVGSNVDGIRVFGGVDDIDFKTHKNVVIAIGEPKVRKKLMDKLNSLGVHIPAIIDPTSLVSDNARIGEGSYIGPHCSILANSTIGNGCCILANTNVNQNIAIGNYTLIGASAVIGNNATIEEGAHLSMAVVIKPHISVKSWSYVE